MPLIPLAKPDIIDEDARAVERVLQSGLIATGSVVRQLEDRFAAFHGRRHAVAVNSGTVALSLAIGVSGFRKVILPAITCPEVLNAVAHTGAEPLIADVESRTHNLDPGELGADRLAGADAVVVTHAYGHPAPMDAIGAVCRERGMALVEDFAQATGAAWKGERCGSRGVIAATSLYATKSLTTGHGGMVLTDSSETARRLRIARGDDAYDCLENLVPLNLKMTDFQAALGLCQLDRLEGFIRNRRDRAALYRDLLAGTGGITPLQEQEGARSCYYKFVVMLEGIRKETFIAGMRERGVQVGVLYDPPLHRMKLMKERFGPQGSLPVAERIAQQAVSLPIFSSMREDDVRLVCRAAREVMG
jgi:dTDP-4-amino-4,6-dideoxygalactose transaminase